MHLSEAHVGPAVHPTAVDVVTVLLVGHDKRTDVTHRAQVTERPQPVCDQSLVHQVMQ